MSGAGAGRRARAAVACVPFLLAAVGLAAGGVWGCGNEANAPRAASAPAPRVEAASAPPQSPAPVLAGYVLQADDTLFDALTALGASPAAIDRLVRSAANIYDLGRVRAGNRLQYALADDGALAYFRYDIDPERYLEATPAGDGYEVAVVEIPYRQTVETLHLALSDCLYCDAEEAGWDPNVLWQLAEEVFAWEIDFHTDIRDGDTFAVAVERKDLQTGTVRYGKIRGSVARVNGALHTATYYAYTAPDGEEKSGYYDLEGHSLRRPFLRSPLKYKRISSGFSYRRRHPILRVVRPHLGVDFAAPAGTPVRAAADGTVIFKGRNGGFGNFVKLRHANGYETWYGHLKGFARGLRKNGRVKQGQVIGYVGATGLATGPHLDYRMRHRGKMVNPLKQKFLPGKPLPPSERVSFRRAALETLVPLGLPPEAAERLRAPSPAAVPGEPTGG